MKTFLLILLLSLSSVALCDTKIITIQNDTVTLAPMCIEGYMYLLMIHETRADILKREASVVQMFREGTNDYSSTPIKCKN